MRAAGEKCAIIAHFSPTGRSENIADENRPLRYEDPHCDDEDEEMDRRISQVAFVAYQQAKMKGIPVARYDAEKKAAYLLYPDGHREYVDKPPEKALSSAGLAPQNHVQWEQKFTKEKGRTTMTYTSAQANKLLKKLNDEHAALLDKEGRSKDFRAAMGEDVESVRPAYDYADTQKKLAELEQHIRKVKHAINVFNATHIIPDFGMTIDEMLVYIPQLTQRKNKLADMKARLPKQRVEEQYGRQSNIIDYTYANYDLAAVEGDYEKTTDELSRAQLALDAVNQRDTFELAE